MPVTGRQVRTMRKSKTQRGRPLVKAMPEPIPDTRKTSPGRY